MAHESSLVVLVPVFILLWHFRTYIVSSAPIVPCYFIFGDSLVDNGNNNEILSKWKANYRPYGVDFPKGVTGRFSNGRTSADIIGQFLGFNEFIPSYIAATDKEIIGGVNYASAGCGIREETGSHNGHIHGTMHYVLKGHDYNLENSKNGYWINVFITQEWRGVLYPAMTWLVPHGHIHRQFWSNTDKIYEGGRFSLDMQLLNHKSIISRIWRLQRNTSFLKECFYLVNIGSNDFVNNYFLPDHYNTSRLYNMEKYAQVLMKQYTKQLWTLYKMGARKVALFGLTEIGCTPLATKKFNTQGKPCVEKLNKAAMLFNHKFKPLVDKLNHYNSDALFTFINSTSILYPQGDVSLRTPPCCKLEGEWACKAGSIPCPLRTSHIFYDALHPSELSNVAIATRSYHAVHPADAYPHDIYHLMRVPH